MPRREVVVTERLDVEALPRRIAHVVHALMEAQGDYAFGSMPLRAGEVMLYDCEALTPRQTGSALQRASKLGLAHNFGKLWIPSFLALKHERDFEERYLREIGDGSEDAVPSPLR